MKPTLSFSVVLPGSGDIELHNLIEALEADEAMTGSAWYYTCALVRVTARRRQTNMLLEGAGTGLRGPPRKRYAGSGSNLCTPS